MLPHSNKNKEKETERTFCANQRMEDHENASQTFLKREDEVSYVEKMQHAPENTIVGVSMGIFPILFTNFAVKAMKRMDDERLPSQYWMAALPSLGLLIWVLVKARSGWVFERLVGIMGYFNWCPSHSPIRRVHLLMMTRRLAFAVAVEFMAETHVCCFFPLFSILKWWKKTTVYRSIRVNYI